MYTFYYWKLRVPLQFRHCQEAWLINHHDPWIRPTFCGKAGYFCKLGSHWKSDFFPGEPVFFKCPWALVPNRSCLKAPGASPCELSTPWSVHVPVLEWDVWMTTVIRYVMYPKTAFYQDDDFLRVATLFQKKPSKISKMTNTFWMISKPNWNRLVSLIKCHKLFPLMACLNSGENKPP